MNKLKRTPIVILNFKTYLESSGNNALKLAKASEIVAEETGVNVVVVPQSMGWEAYVRARSRIFRFRSIHDALRARQVMAHRTG